MNSGHIREGELKEEFDALEAAFDATGIDYYLIGALARDVWFARGNKKFTATRDVDFAVLVGSEQNYQQLKDYLKEHYQYTESGGNDFVMISPDKKQIDLLPFSEIAGNESLSVDWNGRVTDSMPGLAEVYHTATADVRMETGHHFKIATLPAIVLLKLISFDDRPEKRPKDPGDIATIIEYYFDLMADHIYSHHADEFRDELDTRTLQQISAKIIGKEINSICAANRPLIDRCIGIIHGHLAEW